MYTLVDRNSTCNPLSLSISGPLGSETSDSCAAFALSGTHSLSGTSGLSSAYDWMAVDDLLLLLRPALASSSSSLSSFHSSSDPWRRLPASLPPVCLRPLLLLLRLFLCDDESASMSDIVGKAAKTHCPAIPRLPPRHECHHCRHHRRRRRHQHRRRPRRPPSHLPVDYETRHWQRTQRCRRAAAGFHRRRWCRRLRRRHLCGKEIALESRKLAGVRPAAQHTET